MKEISIPVAADAYVDETDKETKFGGSTDLKFGLYNNEYSLLSYIKFNFADPLVQEKLKDSNIVSAEFRLYCHTVNGSTPFEVYGREIDASWQESEIKYSQKPSATGAVVIDYENITGSGQDFVVFSDDVEGPNSLAAVVKKWIDSPSTNYGFRIDADDANAGQNATCYSREYSDLSKIPRLIVKYNPPTTLNYVALGDSYSSGEGLGYPYRDCAWDESDEEICTDNPQPYKADGNECRRHSWAYSTDTPGGPAYYGVPRTEPIPLQNTELEDFQVDRYFYACSGAISQDVVGPCPRRVQLVLHYSSSSLVLFPQKDAYVANGTGIYNDADTNYGDNVELAVGEEGGGSFRSFMKFDLPPAIPFVPSSAELRIRHSGCTGCGSDNTVTVSYVTSFWNETGITWNNSVGLVGDAIVSETFTATSGEWISIDVTQAVNGWYGPKTNYGLVFTSTGSVGPLSWFHSKEAVGSRQDEEICEWSEPDNIRQIDQPYVESADLVTISIGGNDIGFADIVKRCLWSSNSPTSNPPVSNELCENLDPPGKDPLPGEDRPKTVREWADQRFSLLFDRLRAVYRGINEETGNKPLFVIGYPNLSYEENCQEDCNFTDSIFELKFKFKWEDVKFMNEVGNRLNKIVKCAAAYEDVFFVDVDKDFKGKLCNKKGEVLALNELVLNKFSKDFDAIKHESFHPNAAGHLQLAQIINRAIRRELVDGKLPLTNRDINIPAECSDPAILDILSSDQSIDTIDHLYVIVVDAVACNNNSKAVYANNQGLIVSGGGFAANTAVTVELRYISTDRTIVWKETPAVLQSDSSGSINDLIILTNSITSSGLGFIEAFGAGRESGQHVLSATIALEPSATADGDGDGDADICDNCPSVSNPDQTDTDADGRGDACDAFPQDDENDIDGDGISGELDPCPYDANNDIDNDGLCALNDNCPSVSNSNQTDTDNDGYGDVCDAFPNNPDEHTDTDSDGVGNNADTDDDNDGVSDENDINDLNPSVCGDTDSDTCDDCSIGVDGFGPQADNNPLNDGSDIDADGICDLTDNCLKIKNPGQEDNDGDGIGDACDDDDILLMIIPSIAGAVNNK